MSSSSTAPTTTLRPFADLSRADVSFAGGKGANLGELTSAGIPVPDGFVVGAPAYAAFCDESGLRDRLRESLDGLDANDTPALEAASAVARKLVLDTSIPTELADQITSAYLALVDGKDGPVAVRSSATAEDTAEASFAGMNESFLNVCGAEAVLKAVRDCWGSLFGARTLFYRAERGFSPSGMDIAVVVQREVPATRAGVMFTIDPASGRQDHIVIEGAHGLGESVVSGSVTPDRYIVDKTTRDIVAREVHTKEVAIEATAGGGTVTRALEGEEAKRPVLDDDQVHTLADLAVKIEDHYAEPQDTEWAVDPDGGIWMLQSRPVTSFGGDGESADDDVDDAARTGAALLHGLGAAPGHASGRVRRITTLSEAGDLGPGDILVTARTAPDWVPLMKRAAAIVTDTGGMTCHAAIVSRELGIPCIVGAGTATTDLEEGALVTVDATRGVVLAGAAPAAASVAPAGTVAAAAPVTATRLLVNLSEPSQAEHAAALEVEGVGLLRAELMALEALSGRHPQLLVEQGHGEEFVSRMAEGLETFANAFGSRPITYRTLDFRTNEFRGLEGGDRFEPQEENPMIGFRGALRYTQNPEVFALELAAISRVWDNGHRNLHVMLPFVRTARELQLCRELVRKAGLLDQPGFELWVMAEVPSVLFNLERYAALGIAGISVGSNDLTQLLLGADRDSEVLAETFDERDPAVQDYLRQLIPRAKALGLSTSICGQAPSVHPEYADILVGAGIDAISVSMDAVDSTRRLIAAAEQRLVLDAARRRA